MLIELLTERYPGMRAWLTQRLTALVMAAYSILLLVRIIVLQPGIYEEWLGFFQPLWFRIASWVFWICLSIHAWLGVRDVFKDYVSSSDARSVLLKLLAVLLWMYLAWATWLLWQI